MTDLLDRAVRSALQDYFDASPERIDVPLESAPESPRSRRPLPLSRTSMVAAATVVMIGVGGLIVLRDGGRENGRASGTPPATTEAAPEEYTIVSGDFLFDIAERHCVTMEALAEYNGWDDGVDTPLFPDQVISIPPDGCEPGTPLSTSPASLPTENPADFATRATPTAFPVVAETPASARPTGAFSAIPRGEPFSEVLIGRIESETIVDAVIINVGATRESIGPTDLEGEETTVLAQDAVVIANSGLSDEYGDTVIWGDQPAFLAIGDDPAAFLAQLDPDSIRASLPANSWLAPELTFGDLPEGYEVIVDSQVVGAGALIAVLGIGDNEVSVATRNMLPAMAIAGSVTQVDINGMTGWMFADDVSRDVSWQVDSSTFAYLKIDDDMTAEESLALARSVTFLPAWQWMTLYDVPLPAFPPSPTTNPAN